MHRILVGSLLLCTLSDSAFAVGPITVAVEAGRVSHGTVSGIVDVPPEQVLAIISDCAGNDRWFPDALDTEVVSIGADGLRCSGRTDLPWPIPDRSWQIDTRTVSGPESAVASFDYVEGSGNLTSLTGRYTLERVDGDRTRVTYEASVDIGIWMPECLVDWATRRLLPGILAGIEHEFQADLVASL